MTGLRYSFRLAPFSCAHILYIYIFYTYKTQPLSAAGAILGSAIYGRMQQQQQQQQQLPNHLYQKSACTDNNT
jgi:hypothetical protein